MMHRYLPIAGLAAAMVCVSPASAETINCTNITALPATITVQGVYCLKQDLATNMTSGSAITINTNNVTIDFNGFKLGGLGAGAATQAFGVSADGRQNITLRNGNIRGFRIGIAIDTAPTSGHLIEDNMIDGSSGVGIRVQGSGVVVRRNRVVNTDSTPPPAPTRQPAWAIGNTTLLGGRSPKPRTGLSNGVAPLAGTGGTVNGIYGASLVDSQIVDNLVAKTISSASEAYGIVLVDSDNVEIARNKVFDTRGYTYTSGIENQSQPGKASIVKNNVVVGGADGLEVSTGINTYSGVFLCLDNEVSGFPDYQTFGCTPDQGTFPPN